MKREIADGFGFVVRHPILRNVVCCLGTFNFFGAMIGAVEIVFLVRDLHVTPAGVGLVFSVSAVGGMLGGLAAGRLSKAIGSARLIWVSALVFGLPTFALPLATPGWGVLLFGVGTFFFLHRGVVFNIAQITYRQAITPTELLGRVTASVRFITGGWMPVGAVVGGVLGSTIGVRETLWVAVGGCWCAGLWVFFSPLRKMRDFDAAEQR
jgi:MFS family permease